MLVEKFKNEIQGVFQQYQTVTLAIVFGSPAAGEETAASDLDIAIKARHPGLSAREKKSLIGDLAAVSARPVDLVDIDMAGYPIVQQALQGILVVGTKEEHAEAICRSLIDQEDFGSLHERVLKERRDAWINK